MSSHPEAAQPRGSSNLDAHTWTRTHIAATPARNAHRQQLTCVPSSARARSELLETTPTDPVAALPLGSYSSAAPPSALPPSLPSALPKYGTPALPTPPPTAPVMRAPPVPSFTSSGPPLTPQPQAVPFPSTLPSPAQPSAALPPAWPTASAAPPCSSAASAAVANAVLNGVGSAAPPPAARALGVANGGGAALKAGAQEAVAVLNARLLEATAALADAPIRDAGPYVTMLKDMALAIAALKAL